MLKKRGIDKNMWNTESLFDENEILEEIKKLNMPVWIYGAGCFADDIYQLLKEHGIGISGVFIDKKFWRPDLKLWEFSVLAYEDIRFEENYAVVMAMGNYINGKKLEQNDPKLYRVFYFLRISYDDSVREMQNNILTHIDDYSRIEGYLADSFSKKCLESFVKVFLTGDLNLIFECYEGVK